MTTGLDALMNAAAGRINMTLGNRFDQESGSKNRRHKGLRKIVRSKLHFRMVQQRETMKPGKEREL